MCKSKVLYDTMYANMNWGKFYGRYLRLKKLGKGNEWEGTTDRARKMTARKSGSNRLATPGCKLPRRRSHVFFALPSTCPGRVGNLSRFSSP